MSNLRCQKITSHDLCDSCGSTENEFHAVFACPEAQKVWSLVPELRRLGKRVSNVLPLFEAVSLSCSTESLQQLWVLLTELIWNARNKRIF